MIVKNYPVIAYESFEISKESLAINALKPNEIYFFRPKALIMITGLNFEIKDNTILQNVYFNEYGFYQNHNFGMSFYDSFTCFHKASIINPYFGPKEILEGDIVDLSLFKFFLSPQKQSCFSNSCLVLQSKSFQKEEYIYHIISFYDMINKLSATIKASEGSFKVISKQ